MALPTYVATSDEPINPPWGDRWDGPDLRFVKPVAEMIADLRNFEDDVDAYVDRFRDHLADAGIFLSLTINRDGTEYIGAQTPCDAQVRHRNRWAHFLFDDLDRVEGRRPALRRQLWVQGMCADNRPVTPREVTIAVRDFLRNAGRILITPAGGLTIGGEVPRPIYKGSDDEAGECVRASRAYFNLNKRHRAIQQIERAVRILGERTANGWYVLEARP